MSKARVYTRSTIDLLRRMAEQGYSPKLIAEKIGSTPSSVQVMCCRFKIKFNRSKRQEIVARMPEPLYSSLNRKAAHLNTSASKLAYMLLEAIITGDLYDAVLDDRN